MEDTPTPGVPVMMVTINSMPVFQTRSWYWQSVKSSYVVIYDRAKVSNELRLGMN